MGRNRILMIVAVAGVVAGFAMVRWWNAQVPPGAAASGPAVPVAAVPGTAGSGAAPSTALLEPPGTGGSSMSVVGSMSREERIRRGVVAAPEPGTPATAELPPRAPARADTRMGPPVAKRFPPEVGLAASRFMCLCGCGHRLDECPCNDQPIGAVTMLSYLQKVMRENPDPAALSVEMVDRYGEQVLVAPGEE